MDLSSFSHENKKLQKLQSVYSFRNSIDGGGDPCYNATVEDRFNTITTKKIYGGKNK